MKTEEDLIEIVRSFRTICEGAAERLARVKLSALEKRTGVLRDGVVTHSYRITDPDLKDLDEALVSLMESRDILSNIEKLD